MRKWFAQMFMIMAFMGEQSDVYGMSDGNPCLLESSKLDDPEMVQIFSPENQYEVGMYVYKNGEHVVKHRQNAHKIFNDALQHFERAAEAGHKEAELCAGKMYYHGCGVQKNRETAFQYLKSSADKGVMEAQFYVGSMYYKQYSLEKNAELVRKAIGYFRLAGMQGHEEGRRNEQILIEGLKRQSDSQKAVTAGSKGKVGNNSASQLVDPV